MRNSCVAQCSQHQRLPFNHSNKRLCLHQQKICVKQKFMYSLTWREKLKIEKPQRWSLKGKGVKSCIFPLFSDSKISNTTHLNATKKPHKKFLFDVGAVAFGGDFFRNWLRHWRQGNLEIVKVASYFFVENDVLLSIYVTPCTSRPHHLIVQLKATLV